MAVVRGENELQITNYKLEIINQERMRAADCRPYGVRGHLGHLLEGKRTADRARRSELAAKQTGGVWF